MPSLTTESAALASIPHIREPCTTATSAVLTIAITALADAVLPPTLSVSPSRGVPESPREAARPLRRVPLLGPHASKASLSAIVRVSGAVLVGAAAPAEATADAGLLVGGPGADVVLPAAEAAAPEAVSETREATRRVESTSGRDTPTRLRATPLSRYRTQTLVV